MPFGTDNALVKAAEVVRRIATYRPAAEINDVWRAYAASLDLDAETRAALVDPARVWEACESITDARTAKFAHACTHTTFSPDVVHGGTKTNVIPDEVVLEIDIRTLPGQTDDDVDRMLADALGPLAAHVTVEHPARPAQYAERHRHAALARHRRPRGQGEARGHAAAADHRRRHRRHASSATPAAWPTASGCCRATLTLRGLLGAVPRQRRAHRRGVAAAHHAVLARALPVVPRMNWRDDRRRPRRSHRRRHPGGRAGVRAGRAAGRARRNCRGGAHHRRRRSRSTAAPRWRPPSPMATPTTGWSSPPPTERRGS